MIDGDYFLLLCRDDTCDVLLQFVVVFSFNEVLPPFDGKYDMNINLGINICHAQKMPLLSLEILF